MLVMSRWTLVPSIVVLWMCVSRAGTYPSGAPPSTCGDMVPRHLHFVPQTDPSPYFIQPSVLRISSAGKMKLMLSTQDSPFVGFMLQARSPLAPGETIGGFSAIPDSVKVITCGNNAKSTATHRDRTAHKSLEVEWEAPPDFEGPVVFNSTFVLNGATFWVGVESEPVQVVKRSLPDDSRFGGISTTKTPIRLTTTPNYTLRPELKSEKSNEPIYKECAVTKSCFGIPDGCVESESCTLLSTVVVRGDSYEFELLAKNSTKGSPKYVALALSDNPKMNSDSVMECVIDAPNKVNVYMSHNVEDRKDNERLNELNDKLTLKQSKYSDGNLYCRFTRETVTTVKGKEYDLANDKYYLLLAAGTRLKDNGQRVGWHDVGYQASSASRYLSDVGSVSGTSDLLYRLHGAFMVTAWVGFTSAGILLARYFKQTWVGKRLFGKDQWFIWHRSFMVSTWTLTVAGFILIFVEIQGWYSETNNPHAILGCITTGLAFIQPFGALLRPSPDSPKRPIFNWLHWMAGNCAHILGIVTIFFAVKLNKARLPEWTDWILVSYVSFHVFMHLLFSVANCFSEGQMDKRVNDFPMKDMASSRSPLHGVDRKRDAPHACFRKFLLAIYMVVIILLTLALVVIVAVAPIEDHWAFKEAKKFLTEN